MSTQKPQTTIDKVRTVIEEDDVEIGEVGYSEQVNDAIANRWGSEETLHRQKIYDAVNRIQTKNGYYNEDLLEIDGIGQAVAIALCEAGYETEQDLRDASQTTLEEVQNVGSKTAEKIKEDVGDESDDSQQDAIDKLRGSLDERLDKKEYSPRFIQTETEDEENDDVGTPEERIRTVFDDDQSLLQSAANGERIDEVVDAVEDRYGLPYTVTEGTVKQVIGTMRENDELPSRGEDIQDAGPNAKILYVCELCGEKDSDPATIRKHIANTDDAAHGDRDGFDTHLISSTAEPLDQPARFEGDVDDGMDLAWAIYNNPEAKQQEIADILNVSVSTLKNRLQTLGIDWNERDRQVKTVLPDSITRERTQRGNVTVDAPWKGIDLTDVSYLSETDLPETQDRDVTVDVSLSLSPEEAFQLVRGETVETVQKEVFAETIQTACDEKESFLTQLTDSDGDV